jgi:hypothetical protein
MKKFKLNLICLIVVFSLLMPLGLSTGYDIEHRNQCNNYPLWIYYYGGAEDDSGNCIKRTIDGGFIICGSTSSYSLNKEIILLKTDSNGVEQWTKTYGGSGIDYYGVDVIQTSDGGFLIAGNLILSSSNSMGILIKTDSSGNMDWINYYADVYVSEGFSKVIQTSDGGFMVTGFVTYLVDFALTNFHWREIWLIKTDSNGLIEWTERYGAFDDVGIGAYANGYDVIQTSDGGYLIAGREYAYGAWIIKINSFGNIIWDSDFGSENDIPYSIIECSDGNYVFCGNTYIRKLYNDGTLYWEASLEGSYSEIIELSIGGYAIVGHVPANETDGKLLTFNENGDLTGSAHFNGTNFDVISGVIEDSDGYGVFVGTTSSFGHGNNDILLFRANLDWVAPVVEITKPVENSLYLGGVRIFPLSRMPVILGSIKIEVDAFDNFSGMDHIQIFINDEFQVSLTSTPYTWKWIKRIPGIYTIYVVGYDKLGNFEKSNEITVLKIF